MRGFRQQVKPGVALQAKLPAFTPDQQHPVRGPVRTMAGYAAFDFRRRVLMHKGSAFLNMALGACLRLSFHKTRRIQRSMRTVAVGALHQPFGNAVMNGLRKLTSNGCVTHVAEIRLGLFQQTTVKPAPFVRALRHLKEMRLWGLSCALARVPHGVDKVAGMAIVTRHARCQMTRMKEGVLLLAAPMTDDATLRVLARITSKCEDQLIGCDCLGFIPACGFLAIDVSFPRPVTRFARHDGFRAGLQPSVRGLVELRNFRFVTRTAPVVAHQVLGRRLSRHSPGHRRSRRRSSEPLSQGNAPTGNDAEDHNQYVPALGTQFHRRGLSKQLSKQRNIETP